MAALFVSSEIGVEVPKFMNMGVNGGIQCKVLDLSRRDHFGTNIACIYIEV